MSEGCPDAVIVHLILESIFDFCKFKLVVAILLYINLIEVIYFMELLRLFGDRLLETLDFIMVTEGLLIQGNHFFQFCDYSLAFLEWLDFL